MKHLLIIGARGWGREVLSAARKTASFLAGEYDIKGFLDDDATVLDGLSGDFPPVLGPVESYTPNADDVFFVALGDSRWRKHYADIIEAKGGVFLTIISPDAIVLPNASIGEGSIVSRWSIVSDNVKVGRHVLIHSFCDIGHDARIGDYSSLESYCFLGGNSKVGICSTLHVRSTLLRTKSVGDRAVVGAGSVVIRNVADDTHVFGNPAHKIDF